jgi:hypothetical protein
MAAGLGYKEFSTGDVLTAADANGYLASQVVMVFASAAARTSAIASPQEGMISYLKDTNSTEYYSGSAWVAIGAGAGYTPTLTLLNAGGTSLSGSTTTVSGISGKQWLFISIIGASTDTASSSLTAIQFNTDTGSNYLQAGILGFAASAQKFGLTDTFFPIGLTASTAGTVSGYVHLYNCNSTALKPAIFNGNGTDRGYSGGGYYSGASTISSVSITCTAGSFDAGTVYVYGA